MIEARPSAHHTSIPLPVERIHVEVTSRCNFDCEFCPQGELTRAGQDMPLPLLHRIVDQLAGGRIAREIHFHVMGEPLLYRPLPEAVAYASAAGLVTAVTTNGSLLDDETALALGRAGLARLIVSLQTPDAESFRIRGAGSLSFQDYEARIASATRALLASPGQTEIVLALRTTTLGNWQGSALRIIDRRPELARHVVAWAERVLGGVAPPETLARARDLARRASPLYWNVVRLAPRFTIESRPLGGWKKRQNGRPFVAARFGTCHALAEMFAVLANGDVTFCCMDEEGETAVGNAADMPLADFFHHPEVLRAYRGFQSLRIVNPRCQRCLGEHGLFPSLVHQLGSVAYLKLFRRLGKRELS